MKTTMLLLATLAFGGATAATAQTPAVNAYPACSRTVTDRCEESSAAKQATHHAAHRHMSARTTRPSAHKAG